MAPLLAVAFRTVHKLLLGQRDQFARRNLVCTFQSTSVASFKTAQEPWGTAHPHAGPAVRVASFEVGQGILGTALGSVTPGPWSPSVLTPQAAGPRERTGGPLRQRLLTEASFGHLGWKRKRPHTDVSAGPRILLPRRRANTIWRGLSGYARAPGDLAERWGSRIVIACLRSRRNVRAIVRASGIHAALELLLVVHLCVCGTGPRASLLPRLISSVCSLNA